MAHHAGGLRAWVIELLDLRDVFRVDGALHFDHLHGDDLVFARVAGVVLVVHVAAGAIEAEAATELFVHHGDELFGRHRFVQLHIFEHGAGGFVFPTRNRGHHLRHRFAA